jgi:C1A family cysteine protease
MDYRKGLVKSPVDYRDYSLKAMVKPLKVPVPSEYLQWLAYTTPVQYQGDLGSCAAFTGVAATELYNTKEYEKPIDLSEQFLYGEAKKIDGLNEEGTYLRAILRVLKNIGTCEEIYQPYEGKYPPEHELGSGAYENAKNYRILSYAAVGSDRESIKTAIFQTGPVLTGIMVWESFEKTGENGIVTMPIGKQLGGHALVIVGYNTLGFICKNSWSPYWGRDGYCTIPYDIWDVITLKETWSIVDIITKPSKKCFLFRLFGKE